MAVRHYSRNLAETIGHLRDNSGEFVVMEIKAAPQTTLIEIVLFCFPVNNFLLFFLISAHLRR